MKLSLKRIVAVALSSSLALTACQPSEEDKLVQALMAQSDWETATSIYRTALRQNGTVNAELVEMAREVIYSGSKRDVSRITKQAKKACKAFNNSLSSWRDKYDSRNRRNIDVVIALLTLEKNCGHLEEDGDELIVGIRLGILFAADAVEQHVDFLAEDTLSPSQRKEFEGALGRELQKYKWYLDTIGEPNESVIKLAEKFALTTDEKEHTEFLANTQRICQSIIDEYGSREEFLNQLRAGNTPLERMRGSKVAGALNQACKRTQDLPPDRIAIDRSNYLNVLFASDALSQLKKL